MADITSMAAPTNEVPEQTATVEVPATQAPEEDVELEELDEELIIEDFTIDGICGVY